MLLYIFFVILIVLVVLPAIIFSLITKVLSYFGFGRKRNNVRNENSEYHETYNGSETNVNGKNKRKSKKIFDKNEGEYVDFEEIK